MISFRKKLSRQPSSRNTSNPDRSSAGTSEGQTNKPAQELSDKLKKLPKKYLVKNGKCIIINNWKFHKSKDLTGNEKDVTALNETFEKFNFEIEKHVNLTETQTTDLFSKFTKDIKLAKENPYDCLLIYILSHGGDGYFSCTNGKIYVEHMLEYFLGEKCPELISKPKLFFLDTCQGKRTDYGASPSITKSKSSNTKPNYADFLVIFSAYKGHYAYISPDNGSRYTQILCPILQRNYDFYDLVQMLTFVQNVCANHDNVLKQMPYNQNSLTNLIHFTLNKSYKRSNILENQPVELSEPIDDETTKSKNFNDQLIELPTIIKLKKLQDLRNYQICFKNILPNGMHYVTYDYKNEYEYENFIQITNVVNTVNSENALAIQNKEKFIENMELLRIACEFKLENLKEFSEYHLCQEARDKYKAIQLHVFAHENKLTKLKYETGNTILNNQYESEELAPLFDHGFIAVLYTVEAD